MQPDYCNIFRNVDKKRNNVIVKMTLKKTATVIAIRQISEKSDKNAK